MATGEMTDSGSSKAASNHGAWLNTLVSALAVMMAVIGIAWAADVPGQTGILFYTEQYLALMLALVLGIAFLRVAAEGKAAGHSTAWLDIVAALVGMGTALWVAVRYPILAEQFFYLPVETFVLGAILILLVSEVLRRTTGWSMLVIFLAFILAALLTDYLPGRLAGQATPFTVLIAKLGVGEGGLLGRPLAIIATIVIVFVFMGNLLLHSGGSAFFTDIAMAGMGRSRGGSAKISVVASGLFGSISGSAISNVVSTGVITIPLMRKNGFKPHFAAAVEAAASTAGQLMPPVMGAAAFLMAEFLQVSYTDVVIAAIVPSLLYYIAIFIMADLEAARMNIEPIADSEIPRLAEVMRDGWYFPIPFVLLIVSMFWWNYPPEQAAILACAAIVVLGSIFSYRGQRLGLAKMLAAFRDTGVSMADITAIGCTAGMIIGILNITGLGFGLTMALVDFSNGQLFISLIITGLVCIVLGMSMPTVSMYVLLAVLIAPALIEMGVKPMAAHMFVMYFGLMSMVTPPVALCAFTAAKLADADPMRTGFTACLLAWPAYIVPFLFVYSPSLLLDGPPLAVAQAFVTAVLGVWLTTAGIMGYFRTRLSWPARVGWCAVGIALLVPADAFPGALVLEIAGALGAGAIFALAFWQRRTIQTDEVSQSVTKP